MEQYVYHERHGNIILEGEYQLEDEERDGQNKFWNQNRFKPIHNIMMIN
jgi:hypothetical protein